MAMEIEKDSKVSASIKARYHNIGKIIEIDPKGGCTVEILGYVSEDDYRAGLPPVLTMPLSVAFGEPITRPVRAPADGSEPEAPRTIPAIPKATADAFIAAVYQAAHQHDQFRDAAKV